MSLTILKYKLYQARNVLTHSSSKKKLGWLISIAFIVPYYNMVIGSMYNMYSMAYKSSGWEVMHQLATSNLGMIFVFILLSTAALTIYRMFQSKDLPLLMSLPTRDTSLFLAKLLDSLSDAARTMILPFPVCIAFMIVISKFSSPFAGVVFFVGWIFVMLQLAALSVIVALIIGKLMTRSRIGNFMRILAVIITLLFLVILLLYIQRSDLNLSSANTPNSLLSLNIYSLIKAIPTSWLIQLMSNNTSGQLSRLIYGVGFLAFTLICLMVALGFFKSRFRRIWAMTAEVGNRGIRRTKKRSIASKTRSMGQTRSLMVKEARSIFREPHILLGLLLPLILFPVFFFLSGRQAESQPLYIVIAALLSTASCSISSIGREGRTFSLLKSLPIKMLLLLRAKFLLNWIVSLSVTSAFTLAFYVFQNSSLNQLLYNFLIAIVASAYFSIFGTTLAALFPKFDFTHPMRAVTMPGILGLYLMAALFSVTVLSIKYISWYFVPLIFVPWAIIALVLVKISVKRLERIDL